ncbi:MAG: NADH:ubiquinone oxidoreductase subunit J [Sphingomonadales bacterium 32-65-25]|jgi:NADH-quinone oxidoreductase subunit J|uniref:NADH-quinone oxidoreductase subunit J n=1 Tax=Sandarakinorhabdus limnophila TaxID=210512 RepID=UPI000BCDD8E7|nr:NADH-quinone oxidoreductase subunit J [Sandarakinorhabdus limnophila]MCM0032665.1 NADH-quinone oxidoreductase subunit J [Sandarakinorhabdus limnophila]OYX76767.1 MAG: NADH:ubiquinone oxidoreductase subunit J [Sphingomonadales bacterium 32-65-25]OYZ13757.1 MAG: NADH:ubiquinone oxidoreductase subunit J [Sphingomonadales bacterium 28-64-96]
MTAVFAFYLFAVTLLIGGFLVITSRNPVHSVLWLIVCFFNAAGLFILLGAEFLAMLLVIVYVGAVAVLFLFVVMMLDIDFKALQRGALKNLPLGLAISGIILTEVLLVATGWQPGQGVILHEALAGPPEGMTNTQWIGSQLYTRYFFVFSMSGLLLLASMIGAIVLTHRRRIGNRRQDIGVQVARTPAGTLGVGKAGLGQGVEL